MDFVAGKLPDDHHQDIESHLRRCQSCRIAAAALAASDDLAEVFEKSNATRVAGTPTAKLSSQGLLADPSVLVGEIIDGKYLVQRWIGQGGMAAVYIAEHQELCRTVAIKVFRPFVQDTDLRRMQREAQALASLNNEHVVTVYDIGQLPDGEPFIVMEALEGRDFLTLLNDRGPLPVSEACDLLMQACEGVACAHSCGLIHRDLKPANLFLTERVDLPPCVKVLDFGLAKPRRRGDWAALKTPLTREGQVLGTPGYMSPEQWLGAAALDHRTDIWALGIVLFELLTARHPFDAPSITATAAAILEQPPPPLAEFRKDVPEELANVINTCLEKQAANRYEDMAELAKALVPFADQEASVRSARIVEVLEDGPTRALPAIADATTEISEEVEVPTSTHRHSGAAEDSSTIASSPAPETTSQGDRPQTTGRPLHWFSLTIGLFVGLLVGLTGAAVWFGPAREAVQQHPTAPHGSSASPIARASATSRDDRTMNVDPFAATGLTDAGTLNGATGQALATLMNELRTPAAKRVLKIILAQRNQRPTTRGAHLEAELWLVLAELDVIDTFGKLKPSKQRPDANVDMDTALAEINRLMSYRSRATNDLNSNSYVVSLHLLREARVLLLAARLLHQRAAQCTDPVSCHEHMKKGIREGLRLLKMVDCKHCAEQKRKLETGLMKLQE